MWILNGSGNELVNLDHVLRVFINKTPDVVLIGADFGAAGSRCASLGKYLDEKTALQLVVEIGQAIGDGRDYYVMPENKYDLVIPGKIMDSRVKRRGGS